MNNLAIDFPAPHTFKNNTCAILVCHTLSNTSKMPGKSWSIPAALCITGSVLRKIKGSVCADCYAFTGAYAWTPTQKALNTRLDKFNQNNQSGAWQHAIAKLISNDKQFRWFDSGDLQSLAMLLAICTVCRLTPNTSHWLPTREKKIVNQFLQAGFKFPDNLIVRVSAPMVDPGALPSFEHTSTVHKDSAPMGYSCPASASKGALATCAAHNCTACWDKSVSNISYNLH